MSFNLDFLKVGFLNFMEQKGKTIEQEEIESGISIFKYANEFKEYLKQETGIDSSLLSASLSDIIQMEIYNKWGDGDDIDFDVPPGGEENDTPVENDEQTPVEGEDSETQPPEGQKDEPLKEIFNELLHSENFFKAVDINSDGEISQEEKETFINIIKNLDDNKEDLSAEDLLSAADKIGQNQFGELVEQYISEAEQGNEGGEEPTKPDTGDSETPDTNTPITPTELISSDGGGSTSSGGGVSGVSPVSGTSSDTSASSADDSGTEPTDGKEPAKEPENTTPDYSNMTDDELHQELSTAQNDLAANKSELSAAIDGSNDTLTKLQDKVDNAYQAYSEAVKKVDVDLAQKLDDAVDNLNQKDQDVFNKEQEYNDAQQKTITSKASWAQASNNVNTLESNYEALKATDTSEMTDEEKAELQNQIDAAETALNKALEEEKNAFEAYIKAQADEEKLLSDLNLEKGLYLIALTDKENVETEIAEAHPEVQDLMLEYNTAKNEYDSERVDMVNTAKTAVTEAQTKVSDIETEIQKREFQKNPKLEDDENSNSNRKEKPKLNKPKMINADLM